MSNHNIYKSTRLTRPIIGLKTIALFLFNKNNRILAYAEPDQEVCFLKEKNM